MEHLKKAPKAYRNNKFLNSPAGRTIRILTEYQEPYERLKKYDINDTIVFFGSARLLPMHEAKKNVADIKKKLHTIKNTKSKDYIENRKLLGFAERDLEMAQYYEDTEELAYRLTKWSMGLKKGNKFVVCSGGGPGIMEAANRGAHKAKGLSIGLNISLPFEQFPNRYITPNLNFEFHYFFMRKFWFAYLAKALVIMPGGFGTLDELMEILTLVQTEKLKKKMTILIYGKKFWDKVINIEALAEYRVISPSDSKLIKFADSVDEAFDYLKKELGKSYVKK
ncbi:MAG: TIGR00730 family Rossman fold protein [Ignavibacteriae bacterium]|nr:TIGR00730 family Rossman fold protein [Ignavibacteriota bacterium]